MSPVHKRTRDGGIGAAAELSAAPGAITLKEARSIRDEFRKQIDAGIDPIDARRSTKIDNIIQAQASKTFGEAALSWMEVADQELKRDKTRLNRRRAIEVHLKPLWNVPASSLTPAMLTNMLKPLLEAKKANTAHRLRSYVHAILDYADHLGTPTNSAKFTGSYFKKLLPRKEKVQPTVHHTALPIDEVPAFVARIKESHGGSAAAALHFAILTALRSNEAIGLKWSWIDFNNRTILFPSTTMKAGKEFRRTLSDQAIGLLKSVPRLKGCEFVFPGRHGGRLSDRMLHAVVRRMGYKVSVHGFRSSFRDYIGERTDLDTVAAEHALAHQVGNAVTRAYARGDNLAKRFVIMQAWADFSDPRPVPVPEEADNIVQLKLATA
jgi:integrase